MSSQAVVPRRSRRLATILPASYWISIGYSNEDAQLMEKLQNDMKKYCDGSEYNEFELRGRRGGTLPHHDMMLPHWKKLCKALNGRTSECIQITSISLPVSVLDIILPSFHSIKEIWLGSTQLENDGFQRLASFLKDNTIIKQIVIADDHLDNTSVASALSDTIKNHPTLEVIALVKCGLSDANILRKVLEGFTKIRSFTIAHETLGAETVTVIADFIRSNHPTNKKLRLDFNNISDGGTLLLATALNDNTNLNWLNLKNNDITEEGDKSLLNAVFDPTSMDSIINSNHTCKVYTYDINSISAIAERPPLEREVFKINGMDISIQQKIRRKVVLALCGVDGGLFDLSHFNDLPLGVMPRVLGLIQEHGEARTRAVKSAPIQLEKDALTRLFHTLRGWELPLLFENLRRPSSEGGGKKRKRRKTQR